VGHPELHVRNVEGVPDVEGVVQKDGCAIVLTELLDETLLAIAPRLDER
jgi:hypothetical protein